MVVGEALPLSVCDSYTANLQVPLSVCLLPLKKAASWHLALEARAAQCIVPSLMHLQLIWQLQYEVSLAHQKAVFIRAEREAVHVVQGVELTYEMSSLSVYNSIEAKRTT